MPRHKSTLALLALYAAVYGAVFMASGCGLHVRTYTRYEAHATPIYGLEVSHDIVK